MGKYRILKTRLNSRIVVVELDEDVETGDITEAGCIGAAICDGIDMLN